MAWILCKNGIIPEGELEITENGTYDVTNYASADVNVPNPSTGTKNITANGTYDVTDFASADVNVPNSNSATYTYPSGSTGGTVDMGETNDKRYVNAQNVYSKGVTDGRTLSSQTKSLTIHVTSEEGVETSGSVTFTFGTKIVGITSIANNTSNFGNFARLKSVSISGNTVSVSFVGNISGSSTWGADYSLSITSVGY